MGPVPRRIIGFGLALLAIGLVLDLAYHLAGSEPSLRVACCGAGFFGHLITLAGMGLAVSGVVVVGLTTRHRHQTDSKGEGDARPDLAVR